MPEKTKQMSTAVSTGKQPNALYNEDVEILYDPYAGFDLNNACAELPWPEWNDADLNAEAWDEGKGGKGTVAGAKNAPPPPESSVFVDPNPPALPPPISEYIDVWKRPQDVFPGEELTVFNPSNLDFELHLSSIFSTNSSLLKSLIEQLNILQFYAVKYKFQVEMETPGFVANTQGEIWRPWHLVYGNCKAGKGQFHKPLYCPYGKYVVRLFYMGVWRKFIVDDQIPCDVEGNCMLPTTQSPGELWPIILTKAVFKILSLTPSNELSTTDFRFLSALTAWTHFEFDSGSKTSDQIWRRFTALTPHYEQPDSTSSPEIIPSGRNLKESSKKNSRKSLEKEGSPSDRFCFLFANLIGIQENFSSNCSVAVTMTRDCPLLKVDKKEPTKPWKRIRWIYWAKQKGLWVDENRIPPYRRVHIITFLPELCDLLKPEQKLEAALYDIPIEEEGPEEVTAEDGGILEPEQWCDYYKFIEYLVGMEVFFKPSCFTYNFKVTCLKERVADKPPPGGKTATKAAPVPQNCLLYSNVLKEAYNEPVFLLCESLTGIFLCFSFWVSPRGRKTSFGYLDADQPKIIKVGRGSLVVEHFNWTSIEEGELIGLTKTVGYSSIVLNLKPGRHILKLWINSDSPYLLDIFSNVAVTVNKSPKTRFLMLDESQQILNYVSNVSNSFISLTQKFGKPELPAALRDFYDTILKPKNDIILGYRRMLDDFIETFLNCILQILKDLTPNLEELACMMWALQSLFINLNIKCELPPGISPPSAQGGVSTAKKVQKKTASVIPDRTISEIVTKINLPDDLVKVVMIQRIFRGYRVRLLWKRQSPTRKDFKSYTERLKKICDVMFVPQKRDVEVGRLLRVIIITKPELCTVFRFHEDFLNVLQVEEFSGKIPNVEPFAWVPIARFVAATHSQVPSPCGFYLSCNLEQYILQVFDNDSGAEVFRLANTVSPHYYFNNVRGYTIFVFGWNEASIKTVNWRLQMVKMKYSQSLHLCNMLMSQICLPYPMPTLDLFEVRNLYIPNSKCRIFRCLIKIQKRTVLSLRLSMSYPEVLFVVTVTLDRKYSELSFKPEGYQYDDTVAEVISTNGSVIVPLLLLEHIESPYSEGMNEEMDYTIYILEAFVLNNSWPLTKQEWGLVEPIRVNGESWNQSAISLQSKKGGSESRKKFQRNSRKSSNEIKIENPFWLLQALCDSPGPDSEESAVIEEDRSYAEAIRAMKISWEEKDPGRRKRGRDLRMKFLYALYLEERKNHFEYGEGFGEDGPILGSPQEVLDRYSSLSYLTNDFSLTRYTYSPRVVPPTPLCVLYNKYKVVGDPQHLTQGKSSFIQHLSQEKGTFVRYLSQEKGSFTRHSSHEKGSFVQHLSHEKSSFTRHSSHEKSSFTIHSSQGKSSFTQQSEEISGTDIEEAMEQKRHEYLQESLRYRFVMAAYMNAEQKLSNRLMEQAYEARLKMIERRMR